MSRAWIAAILLSAAPALGEQPAADLEPVPRPSLETVEAGVRSQLESARAALDGLLADSGATERQLADAFGSLGERYHAYDFGELAAACYRNARRLAPREPRWPYLLGYLQQTAGELGKARSSFDAVLQLEPDDLPAILRLAQVELELQRLDESESRARQALALEPTSAAAHYLLGRAAEARRNFASAVEHFERALALQPNATRVHYALAQAYRRAGDRDAALRHLERQGDVEVGFPDPRVEGLTDSLAGAAVFMQRGAGARAAGLLDQAVAAYRQAVAADPDNPQARQGLALALFESGARQEGVEQYELSLRLEPENALTHHNLAILYSTAGAAEQAVRHFQNAVELEPGHVDFRLRLAAELARGGRFEDAASHYERILSSQPRHVVAGLELAMARAELGDGEAARQLATGVLASDANTAQKSRAYHVLGLVTLRGGSPDEAIERLRQAVNLDPDYVEARFALANLLGAAGRFAEAAESYRAVIERQPEGVGARLGEATALALAGRIDEAVARLEEGLAALPGEPQLADALAMLRGERGSRR